MRPRLLLAAAVAMLTLVSGSSGRGLAITWSGTWETDWGTMTLTQSGTHVEGTYTYDSGHIAGTLSGNLLKARWDEAPTRKGPSDAGPVELTMGADGKSFTGRWAYDGTPTSWSTDWSGRCTAGACRANTGAGGGGGGGSTTTATASGSPSAPPTATPTGTVLVDGRPFTGGTVRYGSTVDVTGGKLVLEAATGTLTVNGAGGATAAFKLLRGRDASKPVVELRLVKGDFSVCPKRKTSAAGRTVATPVRQLWGKGSGSFRTRGRFGAATVRGTRWLTSDRCDGTQIRVAQGSVQVTDFRAHKQVTVAAGRSYLAKP